MREIKEQLVLGVVRSYLKLYTALPVSKLARFMEIEPDRCRSGPRRIVGALHVRGRMGVFSGKDRFLEPESPHRAIPNARFLLLM